MKIYRVTSLFELKYRPDGTWLPQCRSCIKAVIADEPQDHDNCENATFQCHCDCWDYQQDLEEGRFVQDEG